jgi:hypothetical protein
MFETLNQIEVKVVNITSLKERVTTFKIVSSLHLANLLLHFGLPSFLPSFLLLFIQEEVEFFQDKAASAPISICAAAAS